MTLPSPTPINVAWRVMLLPHAAAAAHPPYVSIISRGMTKVRLGVLTSSPLTGIKHPFRGHIGLPHPDEAFVQNPSTYPEKEEPKVRSRADPADLSRASQPLFDKRE
ncbi:hypothetical protein B296_00040793 [Ensete ventricosum]|uniref:Uncharacterized protein n=1 Tax=Ensete ventricosum TaxID=4639 RepID=A0A426XIN4_ENSVE|nr:hypothetical protein B296_00040793 [Ensete ventricosum]